MRPPPMKDVVRAELERAGGAGVTITALTRLVGATRPGRTTFRQTVSKVVHELDREPGMALRSLREGGSRRYVLARPATEPEPIVAAPEPERLDGIQDTLTGRLLGDPLPGRSAWAQRQRALEGVCRG